VVQAAVEVVVAVQVWEDSQVLLVCCAHLVEVQPVAVVVEQLVEDFAALGLAVRLVRWSAAFA
jgi:hypothetical protein